MRVMPHLLSARGLRCIGLLVGLYGMATGASAQCWGGGNASMEFGNVPPNQAVTSTATLSYTCMLFLQPLYLRFCLRVEPGTSGSTASNRLMTNNNNGGVYRTLGYEVFADAARTQAIGASPVGSGGFTEYTWTQQLPLSILPFTFSATIYGRVRPGQTNVATEQYWDYASANLYWAASTTATPSTCLSGTAGSNSISYSFQPHASGQEGCAITQVTPLDFGSTSHLNAAITSTAQINLRCPASRTWQLSLGMGNYASGSTRQMQSASNARVAYELHRDSARTQPWTSTTSVSGTGTGNVQTQTVYGRVPAQASRPSGTYTDTVIITLTY